MNRNRLFAFFNFRPAALSGLLTLSITISLFGWAAPLARAEKVIAVGVAAGARHSLVLMGNGTLWGAGDNGSGQLGDGTIGMRMGMVHMADNVAAMAAGGAHSLFAKSDGTLWAAGTNFYGQLGDGTGLPQKSPVQVPGATGVVAVAAGDSHSLFLTNTGNLWAMGRNANGQLGCGNATDQLHPVQVASGVVAIAAGGFHSLFIKNDGTLWGMGNFSAGQLGNLTANQYLPVQISNMANVVAIAAGRYHTLFILGDNTAWAMGANESGQLGDGTKTARFNPVQVAKNVKEVAAGGSHSLFIKTDGKLFGTGSDVDGQLGDGGTKSQVLPVVAATKAALTPIGYAHVAAGALHSLFIAKSDDTSMAMGDNSKGQLANGSTSGGKKPAKVKFIVAPQIMTQPVDTTVKKNSACIFSVKVSGTGPFQYRWYKENSQLINGSTYSGADTSKLKVKKATSNEVGHYKVVVQNGAGIVTSQVVQLALK